MNRTLERDEIGRLGSEIYRSQLRKILEPRCDGQFVAIDVQSGEYEVAPEAEEASDRLWARRPQAQILIERVGHRAAFHAYRSADRNPSPAREFVRSTMGRQWSV